MPTLREIWNEHDGRWTTKCDSYLDIYDFHLRRFIGKPVTLIEFGINKGGSLELWRKFLGPQAEIWGVDIVPECLANCDQDDANIRAVFGNQADRALLGHLPSADIIIDDCSHNPADQRITFRVLWPLLNRGGVYAIEDLDQRHPHLIHEVLDIAAGPFSRDPKSAPGCPVHVYPDIIVAEKFPIRRWQVVQKGNENIKVTEPAHASVCV